MLSLIQQNILLRNAFSKIDDLPSLFEQENPDHKGAQHVIFFGARPHDGRPSIRATVSHTELCFEAVQEVDDALGHPVLLSDLESPSGPGVTDLGHNAAEQTAATVGGQEITLHEFDRSYREQLQRMNLASIDPESFQALQRGAELAGVGTEALNKSLVAFGRRIGEAERGAGPLIQTIKAYGVEIRDANGELKPQIVLLKEFAELIRTAGSDAQRLAIADAAFSETGRGLVNAFRDGAAGIDEMIASAREGGFVIEEDLIRKAEGLDDKFADLGRRTSKWFEELAVGFAQAGAGVLGLGRTLDALFPDDQSRARASALIGEDAVAAFDEQIVVPDNAVEGIERIKAALDEARDRLATLRSQLAGAVAQLRAFGETDASGELALIFSELGEIDRKFEDGEISAEDFGRRMKQLSTDGVAVFNSLSEIDSAEFSSVIAALAGLGSALGGILERTEAARNAVRAIAGVSSATPAAARREDELAGQNELAARLRDTRLTNQFLTAEEERNAKTRERLALEKETAQVIKEAAEFGATLSQSQAESTAAARIAAEEARAAAARGSRVSGGGTRSRSDDAAAILDIAEKEVRAAELRIEALGRTEAEVARLALTERLLEEARRRNIDVDARVTASGRTLREEIEAQAEAVGRLTEEYETARIGAAEFQTGVDAIADTFDAVLFQGEKFGDAIRNIMRRLASDIIRSGVSEALAGVFSAQSGGGAGFLSGLFGSIFGNARGNAFDRGRVVPFAGGGVVSRATTSPMAGGRTGLMGEAGPEAILPLTRINGQLGVAAERGEGREGPLVQIVNNTGEPARQSRPRGPDGREVLRVEIGRQIASGEQDRAFGRFGVTAERLER